MAGEPGEVTVIHTLDVTRAADPASAAARVAAALAAMPPGTEVRISWTSRARLHAPYEPDVVRPPVVRARCPRVAPRLRPERLHP